MIRKEYSDFGFSFILSDDGKILHEAVGLSNSYVGRVSIPEGVERVCFQVFRRCVNLTEICIPASVKTMHISDFCDCLSLCAFVVDERNEHYMSEDGVLYDKSHRVVLKMPCGSKTTDFHLSDEVSEVGDMAFQNCRHLQSVYLPDSVTVIGEKAFMGCRLLCNVRFPTQLEVIKKEAFKHCRQLKEAVIHPFVRRIHSDAFDGAVNIVSAVADADDATGGTVDMIYDSDARRLVRYSLFCPNATCHVPEGTEVIDDFAFQGCKMLKEVLLPSSVKKIGENAFMDCVGLEKVKLPSSLSEISSGMFCHCSSLTSITLPDGLLRIGEMAFERCVKLKSITFPDGLKTIGKSAFFGCTSLASVTLPDSVTSIGECAFSNCRSLSHCRLPERMEELGECAFADCSSLKSLRLSLWESPSRGENKMGANERRKNIADK